MSQESEDRPLRLVGAGANVSPMDTSYPTTTWRGLTVAYEFIRTEGVVADCWLVDSDPIELLGEFGADRPHAAVLFEMNREAIEAAIWKEEARMAEEAAQDGDA